MSWGVYEIQNIFLTLIGIFHLYSMTLDGDTTFTLQVHIIEHLTFRYLDGLRKLQQSIGQGTFTVVDVSDDTEISYMIHRKLCPLKCKVTKKSA